MSKIRLVLAAAVVAAAVAPVAAHAGTGCRPTVRERTYDVAGQSVDAYEYGGTVCY